MKQNINEIKKMQRLAGLITESEYQESLMNEKIQNKYINVNIEDGEEYPTLNKEAITSYLKSIINPEYIEDVDTFMNDTEGWEESESYFFDVPEDSEPSEQDVEEWAKQEISYYLFSKPDEFPNK